MNRLSNVAERVSVSSCLQKIPIRSMLPILMTLYGTCVYPYGNLTRSQNLFNFQYPVATMQSAVLLRALIKIYHQPRRPSRLPLSSSAKN